MSLTIWIQCGGESRVSSLYAEPWRLVESQLHIQTRHLVDSDEEHSRLEELIDSVKPPLPNYPSGLHYLLWTPFRYRAARDGTRFGKKGEIPVWYGAGEVETCLYEWAAHRFLFLDDCGVDLGRQTIPLTSFQAVVITDRGIDLFSSPFDKHRNKICDRDSYQESQSLGKDMHKAGVQAFRYPSARDPKGATCFGVFDPFAFAESEPRRTSYGSWTLQSDCDRALFFDTDDPLTPRSIEVARHQVI